MSDSLCAIPWLSVHIDGGGGRKLCCTSKEAPTFTQPFNQNYPHVKKTRLAMLRGERPSSCDDCWHNEAHNLPSIRKGWSFLLEKYKVRARPFPPYYYDLRLGRECNLACKMCHPRYSSKWVDINREMGKLPVINNQDNFDWFNDKGTQQNLINMLRKSIAFHGEVVVSVAGGEPMMNKAWNEFIVNLPQDIKSKMQATFVTNGTTIPSSVKGVLKDFRRVLMNVSIEATGLINDYIRWPSKRTVVQKNMIMFSDMGLEVRALPTIQAYNILNFWEVAEFAESIGGAVWYQPLTWPAFLDPKFLPKKILDIAVSRAKDSLSRLKTDQEKEKLSNIIKMLESYDGQSNSCAEILQYSETFDSISQYNLRDAHPELYELLREHSPMTQR